MSNAGIVSSVSAVTMPSAPRPTTVPLSRPASPSRAAVTTSPSAVTSSRPDTEVARLPLASPEPWVAVAHAPATEMCGSDPRLCRARPARFSAVASSPYLRPALIMTAAFAVSTSITRGRASRDTRSPWVSATRLNECPVPRARTRLLPATRRCSSGTEAGRWKRSAPNVTLPAQFVRFADTCLLTSRPGPDRPKLTAGVKEAPDHVQREHRLVRRALSWDLEPADVLRLVRDDPHPVALVGAWAGGGAVIASEPRLLRSPPQNLGDVLDAPFTELRGGGGFGGAGFGGGWIGYLGYGLAGELTDIRPAPGGPRRLPDWWFGYYDNVLRQDGASGRWFFEALWTPDRGHALERRLDDLLGRARWVPERRGYECGDFGLVPSAGEHKKAVRRTVELIGQGDIFQANICLRLEAGFRGDPLDLFCRGVSRLRPPYAAFARVPGGALASLSPELFLRRNGRSATSRPIKGTRRRSSREGPAAAQRRELEHSAKDRAENVMIVDLVRNDLSRSCVPGSVRVPRLLRAEAHPGVWHLVSDVRGTLGPGSGDGDLVRGAFPPGSVTGAPKIRAMEVIHELEVSPREVYTGAVGYRGAAGLELNVAIRTFEFSGDHVWLGAGGGIVADSRDDDEFAECLVKAGPLIRAVGGRLAADAGALGGPSRRDDGHRSGVAPLPADAARSAQGTRREAGRDRLVTTTGRARSRPVVVMIDNYD